MLTTHIYHGVEIYLGICRDESLSVVQAARRLKRPRSTVARHARCWPRPPSSRQAHRDQACRARHTSASPDYSSFRRARIRPWSYRVGRLA
jgi:hypothetical protein